MSSKKYYCGAGEIPKGYDAYGTPEICADAKQIRRYGIIKIDKKYLEKKPVLPSLNMEKIKLRAIELKIKKLKEDTKYYTDIMNSHEVGTKKHIWAKQQLKSLKVNSEMKKLTKQLEKAVAKIREVKKILEEHNKKS